MSPNWTEEQDALLRKLLVDDGLTATEAAPIIGRPQGAVNLRAKLIGIVRQFHQEWDEQSEAELRDLFGQGLTADQIRIRMERPLNSVRWKLEDLDLKRGRGVRSPATLAAGRRRAAEAPPARRLAQPGPKAPRAIPRPASKPDRIASQVAAEAAKAQAAVAAVKAKQDADAILAEARKRAADEKRAALAAATAARTAQAQAAKQKRAAEVEARRIERKAKAEREREAKAEAKRLREAARIEERERAQREARIVEARAKAEGRGGNLGGAAAPAFNAPARQRVRIATRDEALAVRSSTADLVARFLAQNGATRVREEPVDAAVNGLRRKGYAVVRDGDAWMVDGRHRLASFAELREFAERRAVEMPPILQAAE